MRKQNPEEVSALKYVRAVKVASTVLVVGLTLFVLAIGWLLYQLFSK